MRNEKDAFRVILFRGLGRESGHWGEFRNKIEGSSFCYEIMTPDLPGTGLHHNFESPATIAGIIEFLAQKYCFSGNPDRVPVLMLGLSLGGLVAAAAVMSGRFHADRLVLINSSFGWLSPWHRRLRIQALPLLLGAVGSPPGVTRESLILKLVSNKNHPGEDVVKRHAQIGERHPVSLRTVSAQIRAAATYRPEIRSLKTLPESLVLCSGKDKMVDKTCSQSIGEYLKCPVRTHPEAGHDLPLDDPDWVVREVSRWLVPKTPGTKDAGF